MPKKTLGFCALCAATPALAATCEPGYYLENGACHDCGSGYYCTGGTHRESCTTTVRPQDPTPIQIYNISSGNWDDLIHGARISDCFCSWYFSGDETRTRYLRERECINGPDGGYQYTRYDWCRTGYYAADPLYFNNWYTACAPCTNGPAHSHYTSYSTPSEMYAVESNCPWACDDGYGRVGDTCEPLCASGIRYIKTSGGLQFNLYPVAYSSPVLVVGYNGTQCYGVLGPGRSSNTITVHFGGQTYHLEN